MIETKDVQTRHEVVDLLEEAIYGAEQYWGNCYVVDQLSMLAYRIAEGKAGFVENEAEAEKEEDVVGTTLDACDDMMEGMISPSQFSNLLLGLPDKDVENIIKWAWHCRKELERDKKERNQRYLHIPGPLYNDSTNDTNTDSDIQTGDLYSWPPEDSGIRREEDESEQKQPGSNSEGPEKPSDDKLRTLLRDMVNNLTYDANNPTPKKVKSTIETIIDGLQKGILALSLMVELYSKERNNKQRMTEETKGDRNNNRRKLVYVAGPYQGSPKENIENAEKVSIKLIKRGFDVITPHKNTAGYEQYEDGNITRSTWLEMDLNILSRCDAIFVMSNSSASEGTAAETAFAKENNIPRIKARIETKVEMGSERKREEVIGALKRIVEEVENDQEVAKKAEEFQRKYGTLTAEDLAITFTI